MPERNTGRAGGRTPVGQTGLARAEVVRTSVGRARTRRTPRVRLGLATLAVALLGAGASAYTAEPPQQDAPPTAAEPASGFADAQAALAWLETPDAQPGARLETARAIIESEPADDARWAYARGLLEVRAGQWAQGKPWFERAIELDGRVANHHFWLGNAIFSTINELGLFAKANAAKRGRDAYIRAIDLNPHHAEARIGLCEFYLGAPGIAGGSRSKAREQADALLAMPGFEHQGHLVHALAYGAAGDWVPAAACIERATDAAADADARRGVRLRWITFLLGNDRQQDAVPFAEAVLAEQDSPRNAYTLGAVLQEAGRHPAALPHLERAAAELDNAAPAMWRLAVAYDEIGRREAALAAYSAFLKNHPDHANAEKAQGRIKRLRP